MPELITQAKHLKDIPWMICDAAGLFDMSFVESDIEIVVQGRKGNAISTVERH